MSHTEAQTTSLYGLIAEFDEPQTLLAAAHKAHAAGYRRMDAYAPFPVEGLAAAIGVTKSKVAPIVLGGGLFGAVAGFGMQMYCMAIDYPLNIGGRPLNSWPAFIPITFEMAVLFAAFAAVIGMIALNGLPQPYHPVFNVPRFSLASQSRFFLCIQSDDAQFDQTLTRQFLESLSPQNVEEVAP